jgi:hypothetical protein
MMAELLESDDLSTPSLSRLRTNSVARCVLQQPAKTLTAPVVLNVRELKSLHAELIARSQFPRMRLLKSLAQAF